MNFGAAVSELHRRAFGNSSWIEQRPMKEGPQAFNDFLHGGRGEPKIVLRP